MKSKATGKIAGVYFLVFCMLMVQIGFMPAAKAAGTMELNYKKYTLQQGEKLRLKANTGKDTTFESSNTYVAGVSKNGVVTAKTAGSCKITAMQNGKTAVCTITVSYPGIQLPNASFQMYENATYQLEPVNLTGKKIAYTSTDKGVAVVDQKGRITAKAAGTANIRLRAGTVSKTVGITVKKAPEFNLRNDTITLYKGESYVPMESAEVYDAYYALYATNARTAKVKKISGISIDAAITTGNGIIKIGNLVSTTRAFCIEALKEGSAQVTYTMRYKTKTADSKTQTKTVQKTITVAVKNPENGNNSVNRMAIGATRSVFVNNPLLAAEDGADEDDDVGNPNGDTYRYASSDASIVTVDEKTGVITAKAAGTAIITAKPQKEKDAKGNRLTEKKEKVIVFAPYLNKTNIVLNCGDTIPIRVKDAATADKKLSDDVSVLWSLSNLVSTNDGVVAVNGGNLIALSKGTSKVTVRVGGISLNCDVTVKKQAGLRKKDKNITIRKGQSYKLKLQNTNNASILYESSDNKIAQVTADGTILAKNKTGYCTIICQSNGATLTSRVNVVDTTSVNAIKQARKMLKKWKFSTDKRMENGYYDSASLVWKAYKKSGKAGLLGDVKTAPTEAAMCAYLAKKHKVIYYGNLSQDELLPGDIVFYGKTPGKQKADFSDINHVAIYQGDGIVCEKWQRRYGEKTIRAVARVIK